MVDRPQTKFLIVFLTALVSLSVMSISALAVPQFNISSFQINQNVTIGDHTIVVVRNATTPGYVNNSNATILYYNASSIWSFAINITDVFNFEDYAQHNVSNITNVTWVFAHQNATTYLRNYTTNGTKLLNGTKVNFTNGAANLTVAGVANSTTGLWWINISQSELGPAGNWNLTIYAYNSSDVYAGGQCGTCSNFTVFSFYVQPQGVNLTLKINGTNGDRTYNFVSSDTMSLNATLNLTSDPAGNSTLNTTNATREILYVAIDTNMTGWVISAASNINSSNILGNRTINLTAIPQLSNRSYFVRAFLTGGNTNFTATNVTLNVTARDNENPSITIHKPTGGSAFTEATVIFKASAGDNVAGTTGCDYKIDTGNFKTLSLGVDVTLSDLNSGDHTITVQCTDPSSNIAESKVKFSITLLPSAPGGPGTTSTISVPVVSTPSAEKVQVFIPKVPAGKETIAEITKGDVAAIVASISITVKNDVTSVYVTVNKLDAKPADVAEAAPGKVFRYLDIKPSGLPESSIDKAKIKFKVEKKWITDNNADSNKMYLNRFADGVWNRLNTTKVSDGTDTITYEATTPGFSVFAISFDQAAPSVPSTIPATTPTPTTPAPGAAPTIPGVSGDMLPIIAIIVVIIIVAVVLVRAGVI